MKLKHTLCYMLIFLFCSLASAQKKEPAGIELCNQVHSLLKKNNFSPSLQSLVVSGENTFPYNIIVSFSPEQNTSPENLLIVFFQDDVLENRGVIIETLKRIKEANYPFSLSVLFAYGEKQRLEKTDMIYGTDVFLENINTNLAYTAVIFDLESDDNKIETTSKKHSAPPLLIKNAMNLYRSSGIGNNLPPFILSQISTFDFISCRILDSFFENDIPAIKLSLKKTEEADEYSETAINVINGFIKDFARSADTSWEHHFLLVRLFGTYQIISEALILHIVTPTIFLWLLFIYILFFVNQRMKRRTWSTIGKIWWSVPVTFILLVAAFFTAGYFFQNLFPNLSYAGKVYGRLIFQIILSLFLSLAFYLFILTLNYNFDERAVDYLLVICCFINQSLFILADISLSPIFILICLLSLLALSIKNNYLHVAVFILMITPLIPYGHRLITAADLKAFSAFLAENQAVNLVIPLVLYPVFIVLFRIITSVRSRRGSIRFVILSSVAAFVIISAVLISFGIIRAKALNKNQSRQPEISISPLGNELISLSVSDQEIFDDVIRTVNVNLKENCLLCDLLITTEEINPILYSDNDYTNPSINTARFRIPDNPPKEMSFKYGAAKTPCRITVSAVIEGQDDGDFNFISHSLEIGEN